MNHSIHQIRRFKIVGPDRLRLWFEDDAMREIDFEPILRGELMGPLRNIEHFNQVSIDPQVHTIVWPNGADFDPGMLYNWPQIKDEFHRLAQHWN